MEQNENSKKTFDEVAYDFEEGVEFAVASTPVLFTEYQVQIRMLYKRYNNYYIIIFRC